MANPPGCPDREITEIILPGHGPHQGKGAFLKLSCGHWLWEGGFSVEAAKNVVGLHDFRVPTKRPCLGGCYVHQKAMGRDC